MLAAKLPTAKPGPAPTPSLDSIAQQLGVDLAAEPELMQLVAEMRTTPLPPTWTVVATTRPGHPATHEYVNCVTGERTVEHPGTAYFTSLVEQERRGNGKEGLGGVSVLLSAPPPQHAASYWHSMNGNSASADNSGSSSVGVDHCGLRSPMPGPPLQEGGGGGLYSSIVGGTGDSVADCQAMPAGVNSTSEINVVRRARENPQEVESRSMPTSAEGDATQGGSTAARKRASSARGKSANKRRMPPPKWLVFTSWWHETTSGTESVLNRKHASIRYNTANASFEVELEDVPAIFEVSHATGRHGKIGTGDIRVGAQISILGRQMRLMQCDGLTAQWLESEVRAIKKAKAALVSALEKGGGTVRVTCRSDRLELSASAQRGSGSVGHASEMDRRALMRDVLVLRDTLAQTRPEEAMRLTKGLLV